MTVASAPARIRQLVEEERGRFEVPGCSVVVVRDGEVVLCEGFGQRDVDQDLPVTPQTLMPIGSSTKTFTAALCAALVDEGLLDWDRPIREYLPGFRLQDPIANELLSVRDCLSHRSGLPRHDMIWYADNGKVTRDDLIAALRHLPPSKPFRQTWQYNNLLYITAGHLAGKLTGGTFEEAVQSRLLDPLGMRRTNFSIVDNQADADHSRPYVRPIGEKDVKAVAYASLELAGPAGDINSCAEELTPWLFTLLGKGADGRDPLLSAAVLNELRTPTMPLPVSAPGTGGTPVGYGLALVLEDYRGFRVTHHGGNIDGFSSQVLTVPEAGIGIAVLTNLGGTPLRDVVPYVVLDELLGLEPRAHGEQTKAKHDAILQGAEQAKGQRAASGKALASVRPLEDYAGSYVHEGYGAITVTWTGDALTATYSGLPQGRLEHRHLEVFEFVLDLGGQEQRVPVQFTHDLEAEVDGLVAVFEAAVPPLRFARQADTAHLTDALLDELAGTYSLGPITAVISRRGDKDLVISIEGGAPTALMPVRGRTFSLSGTLLEFAGDGRLVTPMGEFIRA